jgi:hypothetical protein
LKLNPKHPYIPEDDSARIGQRSRIGEGDKINRNCRHMRDRHNRGRTRLRVDNLQLPEYVTSMEVNDSNPVAAKGGALCDLCQAIDQYVDDRVRVCFAKDEFAWCVEAFAADRFEFDHLRGGETLQQCG